MSSQRALAAFRGSFRATKIAFGARDQIRQGMRNPDPKKSPEDNIKHLEGVSQFLIANIVQARKNETGKFSKWNLYHYDL
ncbi:hypothetical protein BN7_2263 [Wickerhamomyces ciferrii]|uniref:Uncharacterized protein n=1 Tax=Wickerhamomyces ciferrii (strain ATCC 14091 / BCRC 22168 / CBS 111 / JCM 3599 / NBRC 0793 / NRRL Y-1031 F-60-10) TaxID=1206466 RepID=K0KMY2_WICCF|nr:uncharacterized protein BN7_2263 [Wickerhamomyces ciferrii]CCH42719.1 hypothetical protein BN7_2263 [Wickerhamomyces ciferrii]